MKERFKHFSDPRFRRSLFLAVFLLLISLTINFYAGIYATEKASNAVTDIILSNTRAYDLDEIFVYGSWVLVAFIAYVCAKRPSKAPYIIKSIALFVIIRAAFITMTHLGPFPQAAVISPTSFIRYFVFGGDLFFSGHTGLPFLLALIFWDEPRLKWIFLLTSLFFGAVVLLAHLHYTIDVLSAFFISYGISHIALKLFKKDREFFLSP
ncbi:MAG: conserved rane protein of unknown function [Parcubacteria group bacterium]|nr:conserved rane protein of unknown function [Parcubacteria group bacterium]